MDIVGSKQKIENFNNYLLALEFIKSFDC